MARSTYRRLGDLLRRRQRVHMRISNKQRPILKDHHRQGPVGPQLAAAKYLLHIVQVPAKLAECSANEAVGLATMDSNRTNRCRIRAHDRTGQIRRDALTRHDLVIAAPEVAIAWVILWIDQFKILASPRRNPETLTARLDHLWPTNQNGALRCLFQNCLRRTQHALILTLGKNDPPRGMARRIKHRPHQKRRLKDRRIEPLLISLQILQRFGCNARFHSRFGHSRADDSRKTRVKRLGNKIVRAKGQRFALIGRRRFRTCGRARQSRDPVHTADLHRIIDLGCAHIKRTTEDKRKTQHIVDLVRIVRPPRRNHRIRRHSTHLIRHNLGGGVRQRKDHGPLAHLLHMLRFKHTGPRQAQKHIRTINHIIKCALVRLLCKCRLLGVHVLFAALINEAVNVTKPDIFTLHTELQQKVQAGDPCRAAARADNLDVFKLLTHHMQRICRRRAHNNRCAVLVVMKDRDAHALTADFLHNKAVRRFDVLKVDRSKGWLQRTNNLGQLHRVALVHFDIKAINPCKFLEQDSLAFHHGLGRQRADIAKAQHSRAVCHHSHKVSAGRVTACICWIFSNFDTGLRDTRRVSTGEVASVCHRLRRADLKLPGAWKFMIVQRRFSRRFGLINRHGLSLGAEPFQK